MEKENLGSDRFVTYRLPKEDVVKAINHWLTVVCRQEDIIVEEVEPEFDWSEIQDMFNAWKETYDGVKVVCKFKENEE